MLYYKALPFKKNIKYYGTAQCSLVKAEPSQSPSDSECSKALGEVTKISKNECLIGKILACV